MSDKPGADSKRVVYFAAAVSALGGLLFGYDTGVISGAILFIVKDFSLTPGIEEVVVSAVLLGSLIGVRVPPDSGRVYFRLALGDVHAVMLAPPGDLSPYFTDLSVAPDGRHQLYLSSDPVHRKTAMIRAWPAGPPLLQSPPTPECDCDVDLHHAHWVTADSFELATQIDSLAWERVPRGDRS